MRRRRRRGQMGRCTQEVRCLMIAALYRWLNVVSRRPARSTRDDRFQEIDGCHTRDDITLSCHDLRRPRSDKLRRPRTRRVSVMHDAARDLPTATAQCEKTCKRSHGLHGGGPHVGDLTSGMDAFVRDLLVDKRTPLGAQRTGCREIRAQGSVAGSALVPDTVV